MHVRGSKTLRHLLLAAILLLAAPWPAGLAVAGGSQDLRLQVDAHQHVTLAGRTASLRTLVEDLCFRSGVALELYDAEDRPFGGSYGQMSLSDLIPRLLLRESYMVGTIRDAAGDADQVMWLRVFGDPAVAAARRAAGAGGTEGRLQVPPALLQAAFAAPGASAEDAAAKTSALSMIAARLSGDPHQLESFLATEPAQIALALARFDGAQQTLRELRDRYPDPRVAAKIDEIIAALAAPAALDAPATPAVPAVPAAPAAPATPDAPASLAAPPPGQ